MYIAYPLAYPFLLSTDRQSVRKRLAERTTFPIPARHSIPIPRCRRLPPRRAHHRRAVIII